MNDEISEIIDNPKILMLSYGNYISLDDYVKLKDYITNLQHTEDLYNQLLKDYDELQQEKERLKQELNCKEYFSSTMPENTEFVILTKNNYDRQQKDIQLELIDYKLRCEKAVEYIENHQLVFELSSKKVISQWFDMFYKDTLNILNGDNNE